MPATIWTVTLNPALDEAITLDSLVRGSVNRCAFAGLDPGGKGINASRVIHRLGRPTMAFGFTGGVSGGFLASALDAEGVPHAFDSVAGFTRVNIMLYEVASAERTRLYLPGPAVAEDDYLRLLSRLDVVAPHDIVVLGGSVPPGLPVSTPARLAEWLHERDARCIIDTSGEALALALAQRPLLVKPNVEEAQEMLGRTLHTEDDIIEAARELRELGAQYAVISRGDLGAIGAGPDGIYTVLPASMHLSSAVGAGDSMTAGMAIAFNEGMTFEAALRLGSACGTATSMTSGTKLCEADAVYRLLDNVRIEHLLSIAPL